MQTKPDIIIPTCKSELETAPLINDLEGYSIGCRIIATCKKQSAAANRNEGLKYSESEIVIMCDDDMAGFHDGWWNEMINPLEDPSIVMVSARLLNRDGTQGAMMFCGDPAENYLSPIPRCPTACIAFRNDGTRFDERFKGSGFEDDDFCAKLSQKYPGGRFVINNRVQLIHRNEQKNQGGEFYKENEALFNRLWRSINGGTIRIDKYWNIPKILHFVWVEGDLPDWAVANIEEFNRLNPDFQTMVHGEDSLNTVFSAHYKRISHPEHALAMKSDLIRLSVLKKDGGWYWDTDFWPVVPIIKICDALDNCYKKLLLFASPDNQIVANGCLACNKETIGLQVLIENVLQQKTDSPNWGDYGTNRVKECIRQNRDLYCVQPLKKIIPYTGKKAALECMRKKENIEKTKQDGAWAIHFELQTTTDVGGICTIRNTARIAG